VALLIGECLLGSVCPIKPSSLFVITRCRESAEFRSVGCWCCLTGS